MLREELPKNVLDRVTRHPIVAPRHPLSAGMQSQRPIDLKRNENPFDSNSCVTHRETGLCPDMLAVAARSRAGRPSRWRRMAIGSACIAGT